MVLQHYIISSAPLLDLCDFLSKVHIKHTKTKEWSPRISDGEKFTLQEDDTSIIFFQLKIE